jgi:hypothetical protein
MKIWRVVLAEPINATHANPVTHEFDDQATATQFAIDNADTLISVFSTKK